MVVPRTQLTSVTSIASLIRRLEMEQTANETQKDIRIEMRKLKTEIAGIKTLIDEIKTHWKASIAN